MKGKKQGCRFCAQMRILMLFGACVVVLFALLLTKSEQSLGQHHGEKKETLALPVC